MLRSVASTYRAAFSGLPRGVWIQGLATLVNRSGTMVLLRALLARRFCGPDAMADAFGAAQTGREE